MGSKEHQYFCDDYLILKPEEATLLDLFLFVLPFGFRKLRKLVDCPVDKEQSYRSFGNRWVIVISILSQKLLVALENLLKKFKSKAGKRKSEAPPEVKCKDWRISGDQKKVKLDDEESFRYNVEKMEI